MYGYVATRHVPGDPAAVRAAIADLVLRQWGGHSRVVVDGEGSEQVYAVAAVPGGDADVWLTWQLSPLPCGTLVRLRLDELDAGPDPTGGLHELLALLGEALHGHGPSQARTLPASDPTTDTRPERQTPCSN